jgi:hypothetical protein
MIADETDWVPRAVAEREAARADAAEAKAAHADRYRSLLDVILRHHLVTLIAAAGEDEARRWRAEAEDDWQHGLEGAGRGTQAKS